MEIGLCEVRQARSGREEQAIALFAETTQWFEEQLKTGYVPLRALLLCRRRSEADAGFWIIKGERDKVRNVVDDKRPSSG